MLKNGLVNEVAQLLNAGFSGDEKPLQSIGYFEVLEHLKGNLSLDDCRERIIISTRQLAKSQRTWFQKEDMKRFDSLVEKEKIFQLASNFFKDSE